MQDFRPIWYTIPEFSKESPVSVYHKENEPMDGNARGKKKSVRNLHVLARTGIEWDKRARVGLRITSWRYQVCQAYSGDVTGYETQFLEDFDSRKWDAGWNLPGYDDRDWPYMVQAQWADYRLVEQPVKMLRYMRSGRRG